MREVLIIESFGAYGRRGRVAGRGRGLGACLQERLQPLCLMASQPQARRNQSERPKSRSIRVVECVWGGRARAVMTFHDKLVSFAS